MASIHVSASKKESVRLSVVANGDLPAQLSTESMRLRMTEALEGQTFVYAIHNQQGASRVSARDEWVFRAHVILRGIVDGDPTPYFSDDPGPVGVGVFLADRGTFHFVEVELVNRQAPRQSPRFQDPDGVCSSPDPIRVAVMVARLRVDVRAQEFGGEQNTTETA